jgi:hypothetical protein
LSETLSAEAIAPPEIPVAGCEDDAVTSAVNVTDTDVRLVLQLVPGQEVAAIETHKGRIEPLLRLPPYIFQSAGKQDHHAVTSVGCLADHRSVRCCLTRLHIANDEPRRFHMRQRLKIFSR